MANRFSTRDANVYHSTYVPLPLENIYKLAEADQAKYDKGAAIPEEAKKLMNAIQVAPIAEDIKAKYISEYTQRFKDLDSKNLGYSSSEYQSAAKDIQNEAVNDKRLGIFKLNKAAFDSEEAAKAVEGYDKDLNYTLKPWKTDKGWRQAASADELFTGRTRTEHADLAKTIHENSNQVKQSGNTTDMGVDYSKPPRVLQDGTKEVYTGSSSGWMGVDDPRLKRYTDGMTSLIGGSQSGKYELQKFIINNYGGGNEVADYDYRKLEADVAKGDKLAIEIKNKFDQKLKDEIHGFNEYQVGASTTYKQNQQVVNNENEARRQQAAREAAAETAKELATVHDASGVAASVKAESANKLLQAASPNGTSSLQFNDNLKIELKKPKIEKRTIYTDTSGQSFVEGTNPNGWSLMSRKDAIDKLGMTTEQLGTKVAGDYEMFLISPNKKGVTQVNKTPNQNPTGNATKNSGWSLKDYNNQEELIAQEVELAEFAKNARVPIPKEYQDKSGHVKKGMAKDYFEYVVLPIYEKNAKAASGLNTDNVLLLDATETEDFQKKYMDVHNTVTNSWEVLSGDPEAIADVNKKSKNTKFNKFQDYTINGTRPKLGGNVIELYGPNNKKIIVKMNDNTLERSGQELADYLQTVEKNRINPQNVYKTVITNPITQQKQKLSDYAIDISKGIPGFEENTKDLSDRGYMLNDVRLNTKGSPVFTFSDINNPENDVVMKIVNGQFQKMSKINHVKTEQLDTRQRLWEQTHKASNADTKQNNQTPTQ